MVVVGEALPPLFLAFVLLLLLGVKVLVDAILFFSSAPTFADDTTDDPVPEVAVFFALPFSPFLPLLLLLIVVNIDDTVLLVVASVALASSVAPATGTRTLVLTIISIAISILALSIRRRRLRGSFRGGGGEKNPSSLVPSRVSPPLLSPVLSFSPLRRSQSFPSLVSSVRLRPVLPFSLVACCSPPSLFNALKPPFFVRRRHRHHQSGDRFTIRTTKKTPPPFRKLVPTFPLRLMYLFDNKGARSTSLIISGKKMVVIIFFLSFPPPPPVPKEEEEESCSERQRTRCFLHRFCLLLCCSF